MRRNLFNVINEFHDDGKDPNKVDGVRKITSVGEKSIKKGDHVLIDHGEGYDVVIVLERMAEFGKVTVTSGFLIKGSYGVAYGAENMNLKEIPRQEPAYEITSKLTNEGHVYIIGPLKKR